MARKDIFANITSPQANVSERRATPGYASRGASRSMINSLSELAEKAALAEQGMTGEAVVELDPESLEGSFVSDRMGHDDAVYRELLSAIRERGQDSPILVRPHPTLAGKYQIVFGHRRARAASELGRPVRAVIKDIADKDHVIAQGQENSARENLSFIERAMFAQRLIDIGIDRQTVQFALSVDAPMLTRMLSVTSRIPLSVIEAIGAAKSIGRDRWLEFAQLAERPDMVALVDTAINRKGFSDLESPARFESLLSEVKKATRAPKPARQTGQWKAPDDSVRAEFKGSGKSYQISLKSADAQKFGRFITENLERLHKEFTKGKS